MKRAVIGEDTYELRDWSADDGHEWFFRIVRLMLSVAGEYGTDASAFVGVVAGLDLPTFMSFRDACVKYTALVSRDAGGNELVQPLTALKNQLRGKHVELLLLMRAHVEAQFSGPFSRLGDVFAGLAPSLKASSKSESPKE